jgi:hypothetical protein
MTEMLSPEPVDRTPAAISAEAMKKLWEATRDITVVDVAVGSLKLQINRTADNESLYMEM